MATITAPTDPRPQFSLAAIAVASHCLGGHPSADRPGPLVAAGARVGGFPERPPKAADPAVSRRSDQGPLKTRATGSAR